MELVDFNLVRCQKFALTFTYRNEEKPSMVMSMSRDHNLHLHSSIHIDIHAHYLC